MKETNMEHFRGEIEAVGYDFAIVDGKIVKCDSFCNGCELFDGKGARSCAVNGIKWLMSEYKPELVLTAREKGFVECVGDGWITRCEKGLLRWSEDEPEKQEEKGRWLIDFDFENVTLGNNLFPFITWEDEEPWEVSRLRELKVKDDE